MPTVARYEIGPALRPPIHHDNGFLDRFAPRVTVATLFAKTLVTLLEKDGLVEFAVEA